MNMSMQRMLKGCDRVEYDLPLMKMWRKAKLGVYSSINSVEKEVLVSRISWHLVW